MVTILRNETDNPIELRLCKHLFMNKLIFKRKNITLSFLR